MNASVHNVRANCTVCLNIILSQPRVLITWRPSPDWPFQQLVMGFFHVGEQGY